VQASLEFKHAYDDAVSLLSARSASSPLDPLAVAADEVVRVGAHGVGP
jgi:hypothetical protein